VPGCHLEAHRLRKLGSRPRSYLSPTSHHFAGPYPVHQSPAAPRPASMGAGGPATSSRMRPSRPAWPRRQPGHSRRGPWQAAARRSTRLRPSPTGRHARRCWPRVRARRPPSRRPGPCACCAALRDAHLVAKNAPKGDGHRIGAVRGRSQTRVPNGNYVKRNTRTGQFMDQKVDGKPFKGVTKEK
jgi:hypothetical protein